MEELGEDADNRLTSLIELEEVLKLPNFLDQLRAVKNCLVGEHDGPDVTLSVTHQLKGLEFEQEVRNHPLSMECY